ncbi:MAG: hypothetical protein CR984_04985 [Proteobacteria bacterium]|nr:MAG: hypothetical protein CR984_04985 [Pseudomonadota bacterium]
MLQRGYGAHPVYEKTGYHRGHRVLFQIRYVTDIDEITIHTTGAVPAGIRVCLYFRVHILQLSGKVCLPGSGTQRAQPASDHQKKSFRKIHSGSRFLTAEAAEALALRAAKGNSAQSPLDTLTTRELQVLRRLALGNTNREIASAYHISIKTVDTYRFRLLKKLNLRNNADLSRFAIQNKLIEA